ncbi:MAG: hypothetical protein M0Z41_11425, partial [Peptococcaceae bacterium]|nr:hypothetical protein [Peptococcaceae bacterium]
MKKLGYTIACILVFLVLLTLPSLALASGGSWQQPIPTPAAYGNRVYGYEQATRYWINENGYQLGTSGADLVGRMWSSVFAVPGGPMDTGYTAVTNLDSQTNGINGDSQEYQTVLQDFLEAFNIPYDSTTSSWLVSPAYNTATYGTGSAFSQKSGLVFDVPLSLWVNPPSGTATASGVTLTPPPVATPPYTIGGSGTQNPYPLYVGAAADVGAGYQPDGSVAYWEAYGGPDEWGVLDNGIANMTEQEAVTLYDTYDQGNGSSGVEQDGATTGNVIVSYPFTSELEAIDYASGTVTATVLNPTPYDVIGENWYAYVVPSNQ